MTRPKMDFWQRIGRKTIKDEKGCYLWTGAKTEAGYPLTEVDGKTVTVARAVFETKNRVKLDRDMQVVHTCKEKTCVNPNHLIAVPKRKEQNDQDDGRVAGL